ncbi:NACHT domain-containing protein [Scytonema sp. PCC 10023]|uniref:NACHT domain-containing protein n=1 Tax=Scytonema sp. PCC 10023 TaxID=1680591 RepID=UPI0039C71428
MEEPNPPEKRNINTGGGNYNERIEGDYIQGNVFQNIFNILGGQTTTLVGNPERPKNERILLASVKEEVTARLRQSLHNSVLINLGKESQPQQVKRLWDAEVKIGLKPPEPIPDTTRIIDVFDSEEIKGKLLILGEPGSGKTTTQLELAQALVKRAEEQPDYPVPVLFNLSSFNLSSFNLSSWKAEDDRQSLTDWLLAELKSKYGISKKLGQEWVNNHQLLPLLDGLDELKPECQELCVRTINQFLAGEIRPLHLVVCSRSEEYSSCATKLQLNAAIYLQPLTNNQIRDYLTSIKYTKLWSTISKDLNLLSLVKTPLLLSITVLAFQEISIEEWQHLTSTADRLQYLLNAYVERTLTRDINSRAYLKKKSPDPEQTRMWLVWLAKHMLRESKTEFFPEKVESYSLTTIINLFPTESPSNSNGHLVDMIFEIPSSIARATLALFGIAILWAFLRQIIRLIWCLIFVLIFVLIFGLTRGLIFGLLWGLIFELIGYDWLIAFTQFLIFYFNRLSFYLNGYIPWNYARFLDYCTERLLLQRVGSGYRFIHKMLQDHFAATKA